jgi:hypothetical protein
MAVTPTGPKSKVLHNLRELLANSSWFQTWAGKGSVGAARAQVVLYSRDKADLPDRPRVLIQFAEPIVIENVAVSTHGPAMSAVRFEVEGTVTSGNQDDDEGANLEADNAWGEFLRELADSVVTVAGVLVEVHGVVESPEDLDVEIVPVWPHEEDEERVAAGTEFPYWTATCRAGVGPQGIGGEV